MAFFFFFCKYNVNAQMSLMVMDQEDSFPTLAANLVGSRELPGEGFPR